MPSTPGTNEQRRARRRRTGGWLLGAGLVALFVSTFTVPEAIVHLAHASAEGTGLGTRAVVVSVVGTAALLGGGVLAVVGFNWRRAAGEEPHPEDLLLDERFGDGPVYDPDELRGPVRPHRAEPGDRAPDGRP